MNVPCAGIPLSRSYARMPWGEITGMQPFVDKKLQKRLHWIAACSGLLAFSLWLFDDWRVNRFKVFVQVYSVYSYPFPEYPWYYEVKNLTPNSCYYLGQFPFYWDYGYSMPITPTGLVYTLINIPAPPISAGALTKGMKPPSLIVPFPMRPSLNSGEYLPLHILTRDDIEFFHGSGALQNIDRQIAFLNERTRRRIACLQNRYSLCRNPKPVFFELLK